MEYRGRPSEGYCLREITDANEEIPYTYTNSSNLSANFRVGSDLQARD